MKEKKKQVNLKLYNGHIDSRKYKDHHVYVAAKSMKHAAELISVSCETWMTAHYIRVYFGIGCWGNAMDGIVHTEPCVYVQEKYKGKPVRIL